MIAAWMLYCVAIAILFAVVGGALERALRLAGRPTRWAWVVALAGSYLVPAAAWLRPSASGALPVPLAHPAVAGLQPTAGPSDPQPEGATLPAPTRSFSLGDLDAPLTWAWGLSSAALLLSLGVAALRLAARRRVWRRATVDGRAVLVSDDVGPAVAGLWRPRIVLPEWALRLTDAERRLMLAHEDEHVRARDPWLLAAAAALVLLAPWNLMLWWQLRRLRLAVEMDCDARVLAPQLRVHKWPSRRRSRPSAARRERPRCGPGERRCRECVSEGERTAVRAARTSVGLGNGRARATGCSVGTTVAVSQLAASGGYRRTGHRARRHRHDRARRACLGAGDRESAPRVRSGGEGLRPARAIQPWTTAWTGRSRADHLSRELPDGKVVRLSS